MKEALKGPEVIRRILERNDQDALISGILASFSEKLEFQGVRPPIEELRAWVKWNVELAVDWLLNAKAPTEEDLQSIRALAHQVAANGSQEDVIPGNYRRGLRFVWDALLWGCAEEERAALAETAGLMFEFVDLVTRVYAEAYEDALRTGAPPPGERLAQDLLSRLRQNQPTTAVDHEFADSIRFNLKGPFVPFVLFSPMQTGVQQARTADRLRCRGILAASVGRRVTGLALSPPSWGDLGIDPGTIIAEDSLVLPFELGSVMEDLGTLVEVAARHGHTGMVHFSDYDAEVLLRNSARVAHRLSTRVYGSLEKSNVELVTTLDRFIELDFDVAKAAASLFVHRNTLSNRIEKINSLIGIDIGTARGKMLVTLAWLERRDGRST